MNEGHLITAFFDCLNGDVRFNLGDHHALLHGKHWYPLRAVVNHARHLAGEEELTTEQALTCLLELGIYVRRKNVDFVNELPVALSTEEVINEVHQMSFILEGLTRNERY